MGNETYQQYINLYGTDTRMIITGKNTHIIIRDYVVNHYINISGLNYPHREDGPASIYKSGALQWRIKGSLHRLDGPASIHREGETKWWINGFPVDDIFIPWANDQNIDLDNLSEDDKALIKLSWGDYNG